MSILAGLVAALACSCSASRARDVSPASESPAVVVTSSAPQADPPVTAAEPAFPPAPAVMTDRARLLDPSLATKQAPEVFRVAFHATRGVFVAEIVRAHAPLGVDRFYNLVRMGFYDRAAFFRVVPNFVVQFGIPADPQVSAAWRNANIADDPVVESNVRGTLVFAKAGPGTRTTQLFINLQDNSRLDAMGFSPIGRIVEGMRVVETIHAGYGEAPSQTRLQQEGNRYLESEFPALDYVQRISLIP